MAAVRLQEINSVQQSLVGCPDPLQGSAAIVPGIPGSAICHVLQDESGVPMNLTPYIEPEEPGPDPAFEHHVLIASAICMGDPVVRVPATLTISEENQADGQVCFTLPPEIAGRPGIYQVDWRILDDANQPVIADRTMLSVEPSLEHRMAIGAGSIPAGPITLAEIRLRMRDFPAMNEYWGSSEFSIDEMIHCIVQPIYHFNEQLPSSITFSAYNFPYRHAWLEAIASRLMYIGATWYLREARSITYADGKTDSSKGKAVEYVQVANMMWSNYTQFCIQQKIAAKWSGGSINF